MISTCLSIIHYRTENIEPNTFYTCEILIEIDVFDNKLYSYMCRHKSVLHEHFQKHYTRVHKDSIDMVRIL